ncbi:MAG TPA: ferritin-like domain-containing protein [Polyangiaceae bacterium]|nr:ferritin-like domain-containing protein [Polyangiaceae bacterium]
MPRTAVARALRRGVALALSLATPLLTGCGGQTSSSAWSACGVISSQPTDRPCGPLSFPFRGTASDCGADPYGTLSPSQCGSLCPNASAEAATACNVDWGGAPEEEITCYYPSVGGCSPGRRPAGLRAPARSAARTPTGRLLAEIAHLEAASVLAFIALAHELEKHGAPARFLAASRRAARDEIRHAAVMKQLAERAGARVGDVRVQRPGRRGLEAMAVENAVEGCVGETYAAAVAHVQAHCATDHHLRAAMKRIASDETRHAELSFELARWFEKHLSAAGRRRVRSARTRAVQALARSVRRHAYGTAAVALGLPTGDQADALIDELRQSLWT